MRILITASILFQVVLVSFLEQMLKLHNTALIMNFLTLCDEKSLQSDG